MDLALFSAHHHVPALTAFFREKPGTALSATQDPGDNVNFFSGTTSLFQKGGCEKTLVENLPKCLLQTMVHFLAFGVKGVCLKEKGGVKGKM